MRQIIEIAKREFKTLFFSPIGWIVLAIFTIQLGSILSGSLGYRTIRVWGSTEGSLSLTYNLLFSGSQSLIRGVVSNLYLYIPLLTMGLLSREYSEGTIKLMYSSPIRIIDIVLGKYVAIAIYSLLMVGVVAFFGLLMGLFIINNIDIQLLLWSLFILYLLICTYTAIGLFISSLTNHQFIAAIGVIGVLFCFAFLNSMSSDGMPDIVLVMLSWLQGVSFLYTFQGFVGTWDILYFILMIVLFLGFTYIRLQSLRDSKPWWDKTLKYAMMLVVVLSIGYVSSRPQFKYYTDVRRAELIDTKILISRDDVPKWRVILMQVIPGTMIVFATVVITRRRRQ